MPNVIFLQAIQTEWNHFRLCFFFLSGSPPLLFSPSYSRPLLLLPPSLLLIFQAQLRLQPSERLTFWPRTTHCMAAKHFESMTLESSIVALQFVLRETQIGSESRSQLRRLYNAEDMLDCQLGGWLDDPFHAMSADQYRVVNKEILHSKVEFFVHNGCQILDGSIILILWKHCFKETP